MSYLVARLEFCPSNYQRKCEIAHPRGIRRSVMVITCKYHYPANKPSPNTSMHKRRGVIVGFYGTLIISGLPQLSVAERSLAVHVVYCTGTQTFFCVRMMSLDGQRNFWAHI